LAEKKRGRRRKTVVSKGKNSKKTTTAKKKHDRGNVYLGKTVRDVGKPGLDHLSEVEGICKAIIRDYKSGKISKKTANGRFSLLYNFVIPRNTKMTAKQKKEARLIVRAYWNYFSTQVEQKKRRSKKKNRRTA